MRPFTAFVGLLFSLVVFINLAACITTAPYGNFAYDRLAVFSQEMARDTVKQLITLYPPSRTHFIFKQVMSDAYGQALLAEMRTRGYAILESLDHPTHSIPPALRAPNSGLSLRYVVDALEVPHLYRITVLIGPQSLTRAYRVQHGSIFPAGAWTRKK